MAHLISNIGSAIPLIAGGDPNNWSFDETQKDPLDDRWLNCPFTAHSQ